MPVPSPILEIHKVAQWANTRLVGTRFHYFPQLDSTNVKALELALLGEKDGTVVIADYQTSGRGRENRQWIAPPGLNLLFSLILRPPGISQITPIMTLMSCVAVNRILRDVYGIPSRIKWPNDILVHGRKICGILTETRHMPKNDPFFVGGIGLNVNMTKKDFPPELIDKSTSLRMEVQRYIDREELLVQLLYALEEQYQKLRDGQVHEILNEWNQSSGIIGKSVTITIGNTIQPGVVESLDEQGYLMIRTPDGSLKRLLSGILDIMNGH